ncbi:hypothetical protein AAG906_038211 [Vitis piasezkii]
MARKVEEFKEQDKEYPTNVRKILDDFSDLWPVELPNQLPPMRDVQHAIDLIPMHHYQIYHLRMNPTKHAELKRQVDELLTRGFIRESLSPCGVPTIQTPKKNGSWWIYDGWIKNLLKIDLRSGYHQIRIRPGMNGRHLSKLRYDRSCEDHEEHLKQVMRTLRAEKFYINLKKCTFMSPSVVFLGFVVSSKGVETDPEKIKAIVDWPVPTNIHEATNKAFEEIKSKMVNPPILRLPDFEKVFEVAVMLPMWELEQFLAKRDILWLSLVRSSMGQRKKYSTYDLEFYAVVQAIRH